MSDLFHQWESDLALSASGDLLLVDGTQEGVQRVLRRLLTNPNDYIFHVAQPPRQAYGAGLPSKVGTTLDERAITALIRSQILLEERVARSPAPIILVTATATGYLFAQIKYNDAISGGPVSLSFDISK